MQVRTSRQGFLRRGLGAMWMSPAIVAKVLQSETMAASSVQSGVSLDPDAAAFACLMDDDTQCAVNIWEKQFALEPYNDLTREALHLSLLAHSVRSLDKGALTIARLAFERAKELVPSAALYAYLEEAFELYDRAIKVVSMTGRDYVEENTSDWESRYVEIPGILGGQIITFAITSKIPGAFNYYPIPLARSVSPGFAMRCLVYPMNSNGRVVATFGQQNTSDYFFASLIWTFGSSATWEIAQAGLPYSTAIGDGGYLTLDPNQWHMMEIRLRGSTVELWVDLNLVGQQIVLQYEPGAIGFGVGLNAYESGTTFSAAFDDIAVYLLVD